MNRMNSDEYLRAWISSRTLAQRVSDCKGAIQDHQHFVLCALFRYPDLAAMVTPHLFAGSPASVCLVKAIKGGARGLLEIIQSAARIAGVPWMRFPVLQTIDIAMGPHGSRSGAIGRIAVLKYWAGELARLERAMRRGRVN